MGLDEVRERSRRIWGTGDYGPTSRQLEPASVAMIDTLSPGPGDRLLDIASGHGNCAIAAARRGASVVACDLSEVMIRAGEARTTALGLDVSWRQADATALPFEDGDFHGVTSIFGIIFAVEHEQAAREAVRVTAPGGHIGLTSWTRDGFTAGLLAAADRHRPHGQDEGPSMLDWGDAQYLRELFEPLGCTLDVTRKTVTFGHASWDQWQADFEAHGMAVVARETMPAPAYSAMVDDVRRVVAEHDRGHDGRIEYDADYLEAIIRPR